MYRHRTKIRSLHIFVTYTNLLAKCLDSEKNIRGGDLNCPLDPALSKKVAF